MTDPASPLPTGAELQGVLDRFDEALEHLGSARPFAKVNHIGRVLDLGRKLLAAPGGAALLFDRAGKFDTAGLFVGTDWEHAEYLKARFVPTTLSDGDARLVTLECLSELRILAVAAGRHFHPGLSAEQAEHFLTQVLAFNLRALFGGSDEMSRARPAVIRGMLEHHLEFVVAHVGLDKILEKVVDEVWRILRQRPIQIDGVCQMIARLAACLLDPSISLPGAALGAERLVSALFGPTNGCREDPGVDAYQERLAGMDAYALDQEAQGLARAMHDTGLVSPYHSTFLHHVLDGEIEYVIRALGLSTTGRDCLLCYRELVVTLIQRCIHVETCQAIYGLAALLERGLLYKPSIPAALWRELQTPLHDDARRRITEMFGIAVPPDAHVMAGLISVLGQPLGLGQGDNPACQSTRAISLWSLTDPDYLLDVVLQALRDNSVTLHFEGAPIHSSELGAGLAGECNRNLDALSYLLVPHLDRIYMEMGRRADKRGEDPHCWINPQFHGWWVHRGFAIAVDIQTQKLSDIDNFIDTFYTLYNPLYNGNQPVVHPQPAGVAVTDAKARFVGWHAISILRVTLDNQGDVRVYFFNPNNDSGQDWGNGVVVSTEGHGEQHGESSLPIAEFTSRLYIFHYDVRQREILAAQIPEEVRLDVKSLITESWGRERQ